MRAHRPQLATNGDGAMIAQRHHPLNEDWTSLSAHRPQNFDSFVTEVTCAVYQPPVVVQIITTSEEARVLEKLCY